MSTVPATAACRVPQQLEVLTHYAGLARTLVLLALEREELAERVRLATEAREIVRQALGEPTLDRVVEACRHAVVSCFGAVGMWLTAFDADGGTSTTSYSLGGDDDELPFAEIDDDVIALAHHYWDMQYVAPFSRRHTAQPGLSTEDAERLLGFLDRIGIGSVLFVPLGVGPECLGFLVLTRVSDGRGWTDVELDAAGDIGRDLGRAVANARQLELERAVVDRLRKLDSYRVEVVNTLGHELRNPLFSMSANLELLEVERPRRRRAPLRRGRRPRRDADARRHRRPAHDGADVRPAPRVRPDRGRPAPRGGRRVARVPRGGRRGRRRVRRRGARGARPGARRARGAPPAVLQPASQRGQVHRARRPRDGARRAGGRCGRHHRRRHGIGISPDDQEQLFREYFRSTNPAALAQPGTGLGLAIVARIVARHGGTIEVDSERGRGTTSTLTLPA